MKSYYLLIGICLPLFAITQDLRRQLQTQFIEAADGSVIEIPEGRFQLNMALWMDGKKGITIKGKGIFFELISFITPSRSSDGNTLNVVG